MCGRRAVGVTCESRLGAGQATSVAWASKALSPHGGVSTWPRRCRLWTESPDELIIAGMLPAALSRSMEKARDTGRTSDDDRAVGEPPSQLRATAIALKVPPMCTESFSTCTG